MEEDTPRLVSESQRSRMATIPSPMEDSPTIITAATITAEVMVAT